MPMKIFKIVMMILAYSVPKFVSVTQNYAIMNVMSVDQTLDQMDSYVTSAMQRIHGAMKLMKSLTMEIKLKRNACQKNASFQVVKYISFVPTTNQ